nr:hypothetical protein [Tanacetum cinerariifolium]
MMSRGKGSQGKKTADTHVAYVVVSKKSDPEPVRKKTSSNRRVKRKVTLSADDNIISDGLDDALELGKSISLTEAEEAEAARKVHATHARITNESVIEPTRRRKSGKVTSNPLKKLKGVSSLTPEEQEVADTMQALKYSKKSSRRQPIEVSDKGDEEVTDSVKAYAEKTSKDIAEADVSSLMDIPIQQETPQIQSTSVQKVPVLVIPKTTNLPPIPEVLNETPVSTA